MSAFDLDGSLRQDFSRSTILKKNQSQEKCPEVSKEVTAGQEKRDWFFSQSEDPKKVVMRESIFELFRMCTFDLDGSLRHDFLRPSTWLPSPWLPSTELRIANET